MKELLKMDLFDETIRAIPFRKTLSLYLLPELFFKLHLYVIGGGICYAKACLNDLWRKKAAKESSMKG